MPTSPTSPMTIPWAGSVPYGEQANAINQFMTNQAVQPFIANLPGYANMVGKRSENTQSMLQGNLPQDVQNQIAQRAAERGVGGGQVGSPNSNSALLQALGLNSFQMQQTGSEQLSKSIADTPIPELWNPAGLFEKTLLGQQEQQAAQTGQASMNRPKLYASKGSGGGAGGLPTGSFDYSFYM